MSRLEVQTGHVDDKSKHKQSWEANAYRTAPTLEKKAQRSTSSTVSSSLGPALALPPTYSGNEVLLILLAATRPDEVLGEAAGPLPFPCARFG